VGTAKSAKKADKSTLGKSDKAKGADKSTKRSASVAALLADGAGSSAASAQNAGAEAVDAKSASNAMKKRKSDSMMIVEEESSKSVVGGHLGSMVVLPQHEDIDVDDHGDPQSVHEYVNDIYAYLMLKERTDKLTPNLLSRQTDVTEKMRAILIDWLVEVHRMFKLLPETLFLAVSIIDRYLESKIVAREKLQLVGITSMLIASKYEEIYAPECNDFVYISDSAYTKEEILTMEQNILNVLDFNLTHPSPLHFLRRYSKAAGSDYTAHTLCKYLIELTLIDVKMLKYTSSQIAAGSVYIARSMMKKSPLWSSTMEFYSTYGENEVKEVALEMNELLKKIQKSSLKAIKKKYGTPKFSNVSDMALVDII
jgi:cyclin B